MSIKTPQIIPYLYYDDVASALDFLTRAFGFSEEMRVATPSGGVHGEARLGDQIVMLGQRGGARGAGDRVTSGVFVYLDGVDAHFAQAEAEGAEIVSGLADLPYGRSYTARDPQGQTWFFTAPPAA